MFGFIWWLNKDDFTPDRPRSPFWQLEGNVCREMDNFWQSVSCFPLLMGVLLHGPKLSSKMAMCHTKPPDIFSSRHAKLERFSHDLEKRFRWAVVVCSISQRMKRSKHGLFVFPPKKTLIWRRHFSIGQSCRNMTSKRSIGWFLESSQNTSCLAPY